MNLNASHADCGPAGAAEKHGRRGLEKLARVLRRLLRRGDEQSPQVEPRGPCEQPGVADTQFIRASGNLRDTQVLRGFQQRCERALYPGRRRVAVDLGRVSDADTKLIATLLVLRRRAQARGVRLDLTVPERIRGWMAVCQVERMLSAGGREPAPDYRGDGPGR